MSKKTKTNDGRNNYPSAELVKDVCLEDYKRIIDTYDKLYEKVNIALVLCGVLLVVIIPSFDYTVLGKIMSSKNCMEVFYIVAYSTISFCSVVLMVWATVQLLLLMLGKRIYTVDTIAMRNGKHYEKRQEDVSLWLIDKLNYSIASIKELIKLKQSKYDFAIKLIIVAVITFAIATIMSKGVK